MSLFYIYSSLPQLDFYSKPDISSYSMMEILELNLNSYGFKKIKVLKLWIDLNNIHRILIDDGFDIRGNHSKNTLKSFLTHEYELPEYVFEFLSRFDSEEKRLRNFSFLLARYFSEERKKSRGFLKEIIEFEHSWRILMAGYRVKLKRGNLAKELQYEDIDNPVVAMTLAQKDGLGSFVFPFEYKDLEKRIHDAGPDPLKQYEAIAQYRFEFYENYYLEHPFTLKAICGYLMALWTLEDYYSLKQDRGEEILENIVEKEHVS